MYHTGIPSVQGHRLESLVRSENGTGPFPYSSHLGLASETVAVRGHGYRVPMAESHIGMGEVDEHIVVSGRVVIDTMRRV